MGWLDDLGEWVVDTGEEFVDWVEETTEDAEELVEEVADAAVELVTDVVDAAIELAADVGRFAADVVVQIGRAAVEDLYAIERLLGLDDVLMLAEIADTLVEDFAAATLGPPTFPPNPNDPASDRPEPWRPQFHFSPREGWMNDPCGLTSTSVGVGQKRFHLGAQHLPGRRTYEFAGVEWLGAESPDVLHWTEHRDASLSEESLVSSTEGHAALAAGLAAGTAVGLSSAAVASTASVALAGGVTAAGAVIGGPLAGVVLSGTANAAGGLVGAAAGIATYLAVTFEAQDADFNYAPLNGSAISDVDNDSLLFDDDASSRLVAFHTRASNLTTVPFEQQQHLAISDDHGQTWSMVDEIPAVPTSLADLTAFRDPKVVRMPTSGSAMRWTMAVAGRHSIRFFQSDDVVTWHALPQAEFDVSEFLGILDQARAPDLYPLALPDGTGHAWVLVFSVARAFADMSLAASRGSFYLVGDFDQRNGFTPHPSFAESGPRPLDWGPDYFAAHTWFDHEAKDAPKSRTALAWMDSWGYAQRLPTDPWRGQMTIPRNVSLRRDVSGDIDISQFPVPLDSLRSRVLLTDASGITAEGAVPLDDIVGNQWELDVAFDEIDASEIRIELCRGAGDLLTIGWNTARNELFVDRFASGQRVSGAFRNCSPAPNVRRGRCRAPLMRVDGELGLKVVVDHCSVEVFAHDGSACLTALNFPDPGNDAVRLVVGGGSASIRRLEAFALDTIWT